MIKALLLGVLVGVALALGVGYAGYRLTRRLAETFKYFRF